MKVLHILNDGPCDDAEYIISQQSANHSIKIIDLSKDDVNYDELIDLIEQSDKVFSW